MHAYYDSELPCMPMSLVPAYMYVYMYMDVYMHASICMYIYICNLKNSET